MSTYILEQQLSEARELIDNLMNELSNYGGQHEDVIQEAVLFLNETHPKLYAVQYRSMHTAIHHIVICNSYDNAHDLLHWMKEEESDETVAETLRASIEAGIGIDIEIDYRKPPTEYNGYKLVYINEGNNVDLYCLG